jgi:antitoxin (DNA-binding transcriptional repressor) of toxin-antitoxin stability system
MKTTTVREVQHNLTKILRWIEDGEVVVITRHKRAVAKLVPSVPKERQTQWPDFTERMKAVWGSVPKGKPVSRIIIDERTERP